MDEEPVNSLPCPAPAAALVRSYARLTQQILPDTTGICLLDANLGELGDHGSLSARAALRHARILGWADKRSSRTTTTVARSDGRWLTMLPLQSPAGAPLGVLCLERPVREQRAPPAEFAAGIGNVLAPLLECLSRELATRKPTRAGVRALSERTAELEWLFKITSALRGPPEDHRLFEELLEAATAHLECAFGALLVPEKRLCVEHHRLVEPAQRLTDAWTHVRLQLVSWAQRQRRPLVVNGAGRASKAVPRCKILSVPIAPDHGHVIGIVAFFNPPEAADFRSRHMFLAQHLGSQSAGLIESQFDPMTGLYTRDGLEQMHARLPRDPNAERSLLYIDIDQMRVVNELLGFELGNELIVRVADVLGPPELSETALAARLTGDRFAVVLPDTDTHMAAALAERIQKVIASLAIGPVAEPIEVSVSCGVSEIVSMPQGLARALAAAEVA